MRTKISVIILLLAFSTIALVSQQIRTFGYNISIYDSTPTIILLIILILIIYAAYLTLFNITLSVTVIVAAAVIFFLLPILNGFHFHGGGDSLTHLGWFVDIQNGVYAFRELTYPGIYYLTYNIYKIIGTSIRTSMMLIPVLFALSFIATIAVASKYFSKRPSIGLIVGISVAVLLAPVNNIANHLLFHPVSQAVLFISLPIYILFRYIESRHPKWSIILILTWCCLIIIHPMVGVTALCFTVGAYIIDALVERNFTITKQQAHIFTILMIPTVFLIMWLFEDRRFVNYFRNTLFELLFTIFSNTTGSANMVAQQTTSISAIGGSVPILFIQLFGTFVLLSIISGFYMLEKMLAKKDHHVRLMGWMVAVTGVITVAAMMMFSSRMGFRFISIGGVLVTLISAIAISNKIHTLTLKYDRSIIIVVSIILVIGVTGAPFLYSSPSVYSSSSQITESDFAGYNWSLTYWDGDSPVLSHRTHAFRFEQAIDGTEATKHSDFTGDRRGALLNPNSPPDHYADQNLTDEYNSSRYLVVTTRDRMTESNLYNGLRFTESDFKYLEVDVSIQKTYSNEHFDYYRLK